MSEKIIGYVLLAFGVSLLLLSAFEVYSVFTGKTSPYPIFNLSPVLLDLSSLVTIDLPEEQLRALKDKNNLKTELVSSDVLNKPLNLFAFIIFMGFIANIGFKLASLGVMFLRPIKINLKTKGSEESDKTLL